VTDITMDWLYRGVASAVSADMLEKILRSDKRVTRMKKRKRGAS
jgi:hypothetical protein